MDVKNLVLGIAAVVAGIGLVVFHRQVGDHFRARPGAVRAPVSLYRWPLVLVGLAAIAIGVLGLSDAF